MNCTICSNITNDNSLSMIVICTKCVIRISDEARVMKAKGIDIDFAEHFKNNLLAAKLSEF